MSASCLGVEEDEAKVTGFKILDDCNGDYPCIHTVVFSLDDGQERKNRRDAHTILGLYRKGRMSIDPHFVSYEEVSGPPKDE